LGLFIVLVLAGVGLPFPEDATLILCGFLISGHIINPIYALLVAYPALLMGDFIIFSFGKKYGRKVVTHKRFQRILSVEKLSSLENKFHRWGVLSILVGRQIVALRCQLFLVAGALRMSSLKFLLTDAVSSIITMAIMVGIGYIGGNSILVIKNNISRIEHVVILLIITLLLIYMIFRYIKSRRFKNSSLS
jgi:membrane protein DedA with SNARE-associated domain